MKTALVSGANRGIGLAIATGLAGQHNMGNMGNIKVLLGSRVIEEGEKAIENLPANIKENLHPVSLDLAERAQLLNQLTAIQEEHGVLDILVNNAAVLHQGGLLDSPIEKIEEGMRVNTIAVLDMIRFWLPLMRERNYGRIVNLSSGWGSFAEGLGGPISYSLSKAALNAITMIVARELPPNIKINSMCPGWVRTRMGGMGATRSPEEGADTALWLASLPSDGPSGGFFRDRKPIAW